MATSIKKLFAQEKDPGDDLEAVGFAPLSSIHRQISVKVRNKEGVATREGALLVRTAKRFQSTIVIDQEGFKGDAKDIRVVMMLVAGHGSSLTITLDGPDANDAAEALEKLFASGFDDGIEIEERNLAVEFVKLSHKHYQEGLWAAALDFARMGRQCDQNNPYVAAYLERLEFERRKPGNKKK